jgi:uncharacterized protein YcfJ
MHRKLKTALAASTLVLATQAMAQVTFYEAEGFRGRAFTANAQVADFARKGYNDRASSVVVDSGRWEMCQDARFAGRCIVLRPGRYESLAALGMNDNISSVRPVDNGRRYETEMAQPVAAPNYDWRRRANERVYQAPVTSVHAVMGAATERCWVERQQVSERGDRNVGGAVVGALIGGVLGHQVGGGTGRDLATAGGAVAGAVVGSNVGRDNNNYGQRDVRRCENTTSGTPAYWDVTYNYRGLNHQVQLAAAPGPTIAVNGDGEPRQ